MRESVEIPALGKVPVVRIGVEFTEDEPLPNHVDIRAFLPDPAQVVDLYFTELNACIPDLDPASRSLVWEGLMLLKLHYTHPTVDKRNSRKLSLAAMNANETLCDVIRRLPASDGCHDDPLIRLAGDTSESAAALLVGALFEAPPTVSSNSDECYREFRKGVLEDLAKLTEYSESRFCSTGVSGSEVDLDHTTSLIHSWETAVVSHAAEGSSSLVKVFSSLVLEVKDLLSRTLDELPEAATTLDADGVEVALPSYCDYVRETFDVSAGAALLCKIAHRLAAHASLPDFELRHVAGSDDFMKISELEADELAQRIAPHAAEEMEVVIALRSAESSKDPVEVWNALIWVINNLDDRTDSVRRIMLEAEALHLNVLDHAYRRIFRLLRPQMTPPERRLFALMYLKLPCLERRIWAWEPVLRSIVTETGDKTLELILGVLVLRRGGSTGRAALEERWRALLKLYPAWLEIVRSDERERAQERRSRKRQSSITPESLPAAHHPTSRDGPHDRDPLLMDVLDEAAKVALTPRQQGIIVRWCAGMQQAEIGADLGITQQGVSKHLGQAFAALRKWLVARGVEPSSEGCIPAHLRA